MKKKRSNKANDMAAIERRKQKKAAQQQFGDKVGEQIFAEVANKSTFGPPRMNHITGKEIRGKGRLVPPGYWWGYKQLVVDEAKDGVVTLSGKVTSGVEHALAVELAKNMRGVSSVDAKGLSHS